MNLMEYKDLLLSSTLVSCEELPVENGYLKLNDDDLKFVAVVNRHEGHDTVALGVVRGLVRQPELLLQRFLMIHTI